MAIILCIETSTKVCSVCLSVEGEVGVIREDLSSQYSHAEQLNSFIAEVTDSVGLQKIDAVAVSMGPGSYTGLRIGVSSAKGLSYALGIPLIAISPLEAMSNQVAAQPEELLIPMIDARRMEVFCAGYNDKGESVFPTRAEVVSNISFPEASEYKSVIYFGDGSMKLTETLPSDKFIHQNGIYASAKGMAALAQRNFMQSKFEDTAYFEPFYLKDFVAGKPKASKS